MAEGEPAWVRIQRKTFTRWCNNFLQQRKGFIKDLEKDLADGVFLHDLLEILSSESVLPKPNRKAKLKLQKVENLNSCLAYIKSKNIKLVSIGAEDIHDGKTNLVLGLIWTLILRFQINIDEEDEAGRTAKQALLDWCNRVLNPQGLSVSNFKDSWRDGRAFCGLVNAIDPNTIDLSTCPPTKADNNLNLAFDTAENKYQFPKLLDAVDVIDNPDELAIMTYVSYFKGYLSANTAFAPNCYAEGPGLVEATAGKEAEYTVFAVSEEGERAKRGGANVKGFITDDQGNEIAKVHVQDKRDGTYYCTYKSPKPGVFNLNVQVANQHIKNSPFRPKIKPGEPKPDHCYATGDGIKHAVAGKPVQFVVHMKDETGNDIKEGGHHVEAKLKDHKVEIPVEIRDNKDGTYTATYTPHTSGDTKLEVTVATELYGKGPIKDSPFTVDVHPGGPSAAHTEAHGPGIKEARAGKDAEFEVVTKDEFGNKLKSGGAPITAHLDVDGHTQIPVQVIDNNDGTYKLSYVPRKAGDFKLNVLLGKEPIKDAPFHVTIHPGKPDLNFDWSGLELDADGNRVLVAGKTDKFTISSKDQFGNPIHEGGLDVGATLDGPEKVQVHSDDKHNGTYEISYTPHKIGNYQLSVKVGNDPIGGAKNPVKLVVIPGKPDGAHSVASGDGIKKARVGEENPFKVQVRDEFDNNVTTGGSNVGGQLEHVTDPSVAPIPVKVHDNKDGTYSCSYPAVKKAGEYKLTPTVDGVPIKDAPFKIKVSPGLTSEDNTLVKIKDHAVVGDDNIEVILRDDQLNQLSSGGDKVRAYILPKNAKKVHAYDNGDGTYNVDYPPNLSGDVEVEIEVNKKKVPNGPFKVNVEDKPVSEEDRDRSHKVLPNNGSLLSRLLANATEEERDAILVELESLAGIEGAGPKKFAKPKMGARGAPTINPVKARAEKEAEDAKNADKHQKAPQNVANLAGMGAAVAAKRAQQQHGKSAEQLGEREAQEGKGKEVEEIKYEQYAPDAPKIGFGMMIDPKAGKANLKKAGSQAKESSSESASESEDKEEESGSESDSE